MFSMAASSKQSLRIWNDYTFIMSWLNQRGMLQFDFLFFDNQAKSIFMIKNFTPRYICHIQRITNKRHTKEEGKHKKLHSPHLDLTQPTKLAKDIDRSSLCILVQEAKLLKKELFNNWTRCSTFLSALGFLSFEIAQKIHNSIPVSWFDIELHEGKLIKLHILCFNGLNLYLMPNRNEHGLPPQLCYRKYFDEIPHSA